MQKKNIGEKAQSGEQTKKSKSKAFADRKQTNKKVHVVKSNELHTLMKTVKILLRMQGKNTPR